MKLNIIKEYNKFDSAIIYDILVKQEITPIKNWLLMNLYKNEVNLFRR